MTNLTDPIFTDADKAREYFETIRWPNGAYCPHCGNADEDEIVKLTSKKHRTGLYQCRECREQFTVTVGSVMESSHIPLNKWALGFYLMASSKKGVSAHQLMRTLGIGSYRTAWFMAHRIREAMIEETGDTGPFGGPGKIVEADETYHGKRETPRKRKSKPTRGGKQGGAEKRVIVGLVERGGHVRSQRLAMLSRSGIEQAIRDNVHPESRIMTDTAPYYRKDLLGFAGHEKVNHLKDEYVRGEAYTNTLEGYFSLFKRGMRGVYQHCREKHLHRYLAEFDFRYNNRVALGVNDEGRAANLVQGVVGKRLTYRTID